MTPQSIFAYLFASVFALSLALDVLFSLADVFIARRRSGGDDD